MQAIFFSPVNRVLLLIIAGAAFSAPAAAQRSLTERPDPAVEQTMQAAGRNATSLGRAISTFTRMAEFESAEQLISSIPTRNYNDQQKLQITAEITPAQRFRLTRDPQISSASVKILDELFAARRIQLATPDRLSKAIQGVLSSDPDQSLPAIRVLFQGGETSTAMLVRSIVNTNDMDQRDQWLRAMVRIDRNSGIAALRRVALYGNSAARSGAIIALIRLRDEGSLIEFITSLYRTDSGPTQPDEAEALKNTTNEVKNYLTRRGDAIPSRRDVVRVLRDELKEADRVARTSLREFGRASTWVLNEQRDGVVAAKMPAWTIAFRDASDAASRLNAVGDNDLDSGSRQLIAVMAYQVANDSDWGDPSQVTAFYDRFVVPAASPTTMATSEVILQSLQLAIASDNDPAALGLIRMVDKAIAPANDWLFAASPSVSPLVTAVDHPNPTVRYEAAAAIAGLNPQSPFAGSSRVNDRWLQMSQLSDRPSAIILENRTEVIAIWERLMSQAGLAPTFVSNSRQLEVYASTGDDVRLIVSKKEPKDVSAIELTDIIRRIRVTRDVPLLFYNDPKPQLSMPAVEVVADELNANERQAAEDEAAVVPDQYGVIGGIGNLEGVVEKELLYEDLDIDSTVRRELNLQTIGQSRWEDESLRAGLIRQIERPRSVAGLYELLLESRRRQHLPPLSPIDRTMYQRIGQQALSL